MYTLMANFMSRPQYLYHLHNIAHFRERSDLAMGDFMMRESQPIAFRVSWALQASYTSYADENGTEDWAVAPRNPPDALAYDEVYTKRQLQAPTDPESVIIRRPQSLPQGVPSQLMPPHPLDTTDAAQLEKPTYGKHVDTITVHLYVPITCSEAPDLQSPRSVPDVCKEGHEELLRRSSAARRISGTTAYRIHVESLHFVNAEKSVHHAEVHKHLRPVLIFLHGGGLVALSTAAYDKLVRRMTNLIGAANGVVVSIDYRLSPEHKFPIPMEDCLNAINFVVQHAEELGIDSSKLALIGDSAGGALVASVLAEALRLPQRYPWVRSVRHAALVYPSLCRGCPTRSHLLYGDKNTLRNDIWFAFAHTQTLGPVWDWRQIPFAIPVKILSQFPPTSLILFTHDIQYETGVLFHEKLRRAGVPTSLFIAPGVHAFFGSDAWSSFGVRAVEWTIQRILAHLCSGPSVQQSPNKLPTETNYDMAPKEVS
ncbi:alpha/beta hydrolase fold domain containing protein, putative [Eimeria necatrix]|uniref:Alpha/beta hydrolase fold domain containing protein, putative n=1 Tax=Eimeria necatrix TaxID=51315 RepID=U6MUD8_9EIME|nr:alpha/beta hydrolase fold domain containing protein, putative [Eimeria necatrix]CDJ65305.1 alpha/beta hydrolase fold domain containing protein, putative [Eimeria necatrix]